ncbi:hypothetical protein HU200_037328 [Digitaria exilis]|uniref:Uncharacterized protein n=1 Tax=Digitaria exilis TaxID=1010633 RepID=A0A835ELX2_9POAL|nr:hypothetical protein HU200_037328 [Digitaria exilis]
MLLITQGTAHICMAPHPSAAAPADAYSPLPHHIRMTPCPSNGALAPGPELTINPATHANERTNERRRRQLLAATPPPPGLRIDMEEFQEADVLWPDNAAVHHQCHRHHHLADQRQPPHAAVAHHHPHSSSPPVRIPAAPHADQARPTRINHDGDDDDEDDGMLVVRSRSAASSSVGIVPPHVLAARRRCADERRVASSVCEGHGRTLKGRDLRAVRNAVLHMTGFLGSSDEY